ncbi:MAG: DUF433 domain-containing protein [Planctomycetales bacterium]
MPVEMKYPHIETPADGPARLERVPRVRVAQIAMDHIAHGWSVEEMCRHHPYLRPAEAHAAMLFYFDHRDEIDAEIRAEWEESESSRAAAQSVPLADQP